MNQKRAVLALKVVLWLGALTPGAWLWAGVFRGWLGANPIEKLTHVTGLTALTLLLLTLAITPLRRLTGWNPIIRLRRPMGLFAFFYAVVHFSIWFVFDMVFDVSAMVADIIERKYITVGMAALLIDEGNAPGELRALLPVASFDLREILEYTLDGRLQVLIPVELVERGTDYDLARFRMAVPA